MNNLINFVIYNSIFYNEFKFNITQSQFNITQSQINKIPTKCFGAFISVKRSKSQTLKEWPENIHGCIGNWSNDYKEKTQK